MALPPPDRHEAPYFLAIPLILVAAIGCVVLGVLKLFGAL